MAFECRVECDSISPADVRLTTFVVTFPRFILSEVNTHRMLSRNSASSRAIPVEKRIAQIEADPFIPEAFGRNQKGMQAGDVLAEGEAREARFVWECACRSAIDHARRLAGLGVHKQLANRLLEPFAWHTAVLSATDWANFFALRCHPDAQPEFRKIAEMMRDALAASKPRIVGFGAWHLPFISQDELEDLGSNFTWDDIKKVSAGRACRVSYLTHDGRRDPREDISLAERLIAARPLHASPLEHVATPYVGSVLRGNFRGWRQFRHQIQNESIPG